jgi:hypothetical protein
MHFDIISYRKILARDLETKFGTKTLAGEFPNSTFLPQPPPGETSKTLLGSFPPPGDWAKTLF